MNNNGRSLRLFLVEGTPTGMMTAEIVNWSGHVLVAPRAKLPEVMNRAESQRTGVYFLFGDITELGGARPVYIGESDNVGRRILQHSRKEDREFERFCIITSKDLNLTKSHARYLENRLTQIAKDSGRANVLNSIEPSLGVLPESDVADMEFFVEQIRVVLPVLGYDVLKQKFVGPVPEAILTAEDPASMSDVVALRLKPSRKGLEAWAFERDGEIVVRKGSLAELNPAFAMNQYSELRQRLLDDKSLVANSQNSFLEFTKDVLFASPSAAAAVIYGRNANGRTSWIVTSENKTLKDYQDERQAAQ